MSKAIIGEPRAEMSEVQEASFVIDGRATLPINEVVLESSSQVPEGCPEYSAFTDLGDHLSRESLSGPAEFVQKRSASSKRKNNKRIISSKRKPRLTFGLPEGFKPRLQTAGRSVLIEDNVYRLPGGQEYIPTCPTGILGKLQHLYALLTVEQLADGRRGSVYIRTDGRIFDYSVDHADLTRDMFDTGYTIHQLERTGRYAPSSGSSKRENDLKRRKVAHAG